MAAKSLVALARALNPTESGGWRLDKKCMSSRKKSLLITQSFPGVGFSTAASSPTPRINPEGGAWPVFAWACFVWACKGRACGDCACEDREYEDQEYERAALIRWTTSLSLDLGTVAKMAGPSFNMSESLPECSHYSDPMNPRVMVLVTEPALLKVLTKNDRIGTISLVSNQCSRFSHPCSTGPRWTCGSRYGAPKYYELIENEK